VTRYRVSHETRYRYEGEVALGYNRAVLRPRTTAGQRVVAHDLTIDPTPAFRSEHIDLFGNPVTVFSVETPHTSLVVHAVSEVEVRPEVAQLDLAGLARWEDAVTAARNLGDVGRAFSLDSPLVGTDAAFAAYAAPSFPPGRPLYDAVADLTRRIHEEFTYLPGSTTLSTPPLEVLHNRTGVCQDFAHLEIACLRSLGLAARYTSGYLETSPPPGAPRLVGADASHAWCSVLLPDRTWIDLDPTNGLVEPVTHVTVGWGRDYADVAPLSGVIFAAGVASELTVSVDVQRVDPPGAAVSSARP